ncbi:C40 family peptidase [Clostridium perfringens]|uniref:Putative enterotoxin, EntB n=1 Tax=Clostridium perfringens (strain SM101 / Type A) TaxID=289380 RepID=Q0ST84_CLOPS|nr:C40 family peptidase [Clostridium perfringens]ABG85644.1 putative enterotoxin, EntB [Clostridium perfringens SM101]EJT5925659.1 C40 family peptidase [Clostridium perfringens]MBP2861314.1 C40 family peptidase [Clostridium perfringens]MDH5060583.1 putative endopeptidase p60 precursor [Clostridium perfringens NCTC 8239]UBK59583.1 SH3 domain-containing protein [Clostridium perfringens]
MNRNKIAALIFAVSTVCVISAHSENAYATEHKNSNQLEENNQNRSVKKGQVINVSTNLRIRKSPNTSSDVIGYLTNGEIFNIDEKDGSWYKINGNGKVGYIHGDYVKELSGNSNSNNNSVSSSNLDTSLVGKKGTVVNVSTSLRVRQSPSTSSSVVGSLRGGQTFEIKGKSGSWYYINSNGLTGYIHGDYVQVGENSSNNGGQSSGNNSGMDTSLAGKTGKVVNVSTSLRIRQSPSTSSSVVGSLSAGQTFNINGKNGAWYNIDAQGTKGHVHGDYVQVLSGNESSNSGSNNNQSESQNNNLDESYNGKAGKVVNVTTNLRLRSQPSTSSSVLAYLLPNERFTLQGKTVSGWFKVNYNGKIGYLHEDYVKIVSSNESSNGAVNENLGSSQNGSTGNGQVNQSKYEKVLSVMKSQIGSPYIYGGVGETLNSSLLNSLRRTFPDHAARGFYDIPSKYLNGNYRAFDCSGLMQWSFRQAGISLGRTTWDQVNNGYEVSPSNAKPGDLLFFSNLGHVGMYIGNGQWIEAPNKDKFVSIAPVPWSKIGRARRVL